jgi:DNA-binding transcriptional MerR regulator
MYNIETLSELSGLTKRTVRYYIELGLLTPPVGSCRGSYYTESHLSKLAQIKRLSSQGVPLTQMKAIISAESCKSDFNFVQEIEITRWERAMICEGVELSFKHNSLNKQELCRISSFIQELFECRDNS